MEAPKKQKLGPDGELPNTPKHLTLEHMLDHTPMLDTCPWCQMAKAARKGAYKKRKMPEKEPTKFGECVTADHLVTRSTEAKGINGETNALVIGDRATEWIFGYPVNSRSERECYKCMTDFLGPKLPIEFLVDRLFS